MKVQLNIHAMLLSFLFAMVIPLSSFATDGQIKIAQTAPTTFPIIINKAGIYVLTSNLVVTDPTKNAIEITVNDVTLDLNGFTIQGPSIGYGIYATGKYNITITNGEIWGFANRGVFLGTDPTQKGAGHRIESIQTMNNGAGGIHIVGGGVVRNCVANNNTGNGGIFADGCIVSNCTANNNHIYGIAVRNSIVINCTANHNSETGIFAQNFPSSEGNRIEGNNVRNNGNKGIALYYIGNYAIRNVGSDNGAGLSDNFYAITGNYMPLTGDNANYGF